MSYTRLMLGLTLAICLGGCSSSEGASDEGPEGQAGSSIGGSANGGSANGGSANGGSGGSFDAGSGGKGGAGGDAGSAGKGGSGGDAGAGGAPTDWCKNYPQTDGLLKKGNVLRNYQYLNKKGKVHHICELAGSSKYRYLYMVIASLSCTRCQKETQYLEAFKKKHQADGLLVVEALDDATSVKQLQNWPGFPYEYGLIAVQPNPHRIMQDCSDSPECGVYAHPHHFLVDLSNMQIVEPICTPKFEEITDINAWDKYCVNKYL